MVKKIPDKKKFFLIDDVAAILGCSRSTIYNWEKRGKIPKPKRDLISNYRIYTKEDVRMLQRITGRG